MIFRTTIVGRVSLAPWYVLLVVSCWSIGLQAGAQSSAKENDTRRKQLLKEIKRTTALLNETSRNKAALYDRYLALENQIRVREELLDHTQKRLTFLEAQTARTQTWKSTLEEDLLALEEEYTTMMRQAYRLQKTRHRLSFLWGAKNMNDLLLRRRHLMQYDAHRKRQLSLIKETRSILEEKIRSHKKQQEHYLALLEEEQAQNMLLKTELSEKTRILNGLKSDEAKLKKQLNTQRYAQKELEKRIAAMINAAPTKKQSSSINSRASTASTAKSVVTPSESGQETSVFAGQRRKMTWPVPRGVIVRRFGKQAHPTLKNIQIENNGIDIRTRPGASVKALANGVVAGVEYVPGFRNMVILRHGEYYSVYAQLETVAVRKGSSISKGAVIGKLAVRNGNVSELHLQIWRNKTHLNPKDWLAP